MGEHSMVNDASTAETVLPAVLGFAVAGFIIATAFYVCRLRQRNNKKNHEPAIYQPKKRTTAVRSPSGQPGGQPPHYLKKSPSPTSNKTLPGSLSPTTETIGGSLNHGSSSSFKTQSIVTHPKYTEENEIQTKIIGQMENSTSSIGSDNNNDTQEYGKLGSLVFKLRYLTDRNALVVSVIRCRGLPYKSITDDLPNGTNGKTQTATDPYVKLQLLPEKTHKVKTRVVRNTRNPVYDEDFTFYGLSMADITAMSLHFVVLSFDRYSRDDVIGEVILPLGNPNEVDLTQIETQQVALCKEIQPRSLKIRAQGRGELLVSLCFQPGAARLTVVLLKARNLPRMDVTGLADPYVKIYLLCNGQRIAKKKTHVKKRTLSPVFNESFAFDIPTNESTGGSLENISLELMLLDWDRVTKNEVIGRLELGGPRCAGAAQNHWNEISTSPRRQIAEWHKLTD